MQQPQPQPPRRPTSRAGVEGAARARCTRNGRSMPAGVRDISLVAGVRRSCSKREHPLAGARTRVDGGHAGANRSVGLGAAIRARSCIPRIRSFLPRPS